MKIAYEKNKKEIAYLKIDIAKEHLKILDFMDRTGEPFYDEDIE